MCVRFTRITLQPPHWGSKHRRLSAQNVAGTRGNTILGTSDRATRQVPARGEVSLK